MDRQKINKIVYSALLAAFTLVATMIIRIPSFASVGYVNIGDVGVLLCAWLIGGPYGAFAAGFGSAMADLLAGYAYYVPGTFIIKFLMALVASVVLKKLKDTGKSGIVSYIISGIPAEIIMIIGYFLYKAFILGRFESALLSIPSNAVQGITSLVIAVVLARVLITSGLLKRVVPAK